MKVLGTVKDAATEVPLPGAKIRLYVREEELAVLQSDSEGKFEHESESQYIGEILICKVEKAGYEPQKVIQEFEEDEVTLAIKLVPKKDEKIELTVNLKDEKRNPLKGINISLEVDGEGVGVGISDKDGIFKITLSPDLEGKTINYKAELGGFELASGEVQLKKETSVKITMKKPPAPPPNMKWLKIAAGATGIVAVILVAIIISQIIPPDGPPEMPVIKYFVASPGMIGPGDSSKLRWEVSDATHVNIGPGIGDVALTGSRVISPVETTTYTLTATNDAGKRFDTVRVIVKEEEVNLPVISSFEASPSAISTGDGSTLRWIVSDATRVTIEPGIGDVALTGSRVISPVETTTYTLTATNDAGKRFDTVRVIVKEEEVNLPVISSFEASPSEIKPDESATLSWSVSDATRVTIEPGIGRVDLKETRAVYPTETTIYILTVTNDAGKRFDTVRVIVKEEEVNLPVISSFEASPSEIKPDESATLSWSVSDATRVTIEPGIGRVDLKDERRVFPTESTTYTITATNDAGSVDATAEVIVEEVNLPVISYFKASPRKISAGGNSELSWSVSGATSLKLSRMESGTNRRILVLSILQQRGTTKVSPTETKLFLLTATNEAGRVEKVVEVVVQEKPDLVITRVWHEYTGTTFLEDTTIYYNIKNIGEGAAGASTTYMSRTYDGKLMSTDNVLSLAPGATRTESFYTFNWSGSEINICADGDRKIAETDETNNCKSHYTIG